MTKPSAVRQPIPVGKYFVDRGKITPQQLETALVHRTEHGFKLGQSLVALGFVSETDMMEALRHQARFPCVHLTMGIVDPRVALRLKASDARRLRALALNHVAGHTTVAMEDPSDEGALEELQQLLGAQVFPVYSEASNITSVLDALYEPSSEPVQTRTGAPAARERAPSETPRAERPATGAAADPAADEKKVVHEVRAILEHAFARGASDVHFEPRADALIVRLRVEGMLREHARLERSLSQPVVTRIKALSGLDVEERQRPQDGRIQFDYKKQRVDMRVATAPGLHGEGAVLRLLLAGGATRRLEDLELSPLQRARLESLCASRDGLVLVVGPYGSGRTTTLYALLQYLATGERKLVTLEDPIERPLDFAVQLALDPAQGLTPGAAWNAVLGQDPDVILVGSLGEGELAQRAVEAALDGSFVLSALHARSAAQALTRLMDLGAEPYLLADALRGIVVQRLARATCTDCKAPVVPDEVLLQRLGLARDGSVYHEGEGCDTCHGTGYRGRIGVYEVLEPTPRLRRLVETRADVEALARAAREDAHGTLLQDGLAKARAGLTTLHEILAAVARGGESA